MLSSSRGMRKGGGGKGNCVWDALFSSHGAVVCAWKKRLRLLSKTVKIYNGYLS